MPKKIIISILNWNSAKKTIECLSSLISALEHTLYFSTIILIDNGSEQSDYLELKKAFSNVQVLRLEYNIGFSGGHNISILKAFEVNADFIWLLNNDTIVKNNTLDELLSIMEDDPKCGAVSPVITERQPPNNIEFCGAWNDWNNLESVRPRDMEIAKHMEIEQPKNMWLAGTAILFRVNALRKIGMLDEKLFAYYEDTDIGVRLLQSGWVNRVAFNAYIEHSAHNDIYSDRPSYYFYLITRNSFIFWLRYLPQHHKLIARALLLFRAFFLAGKLNDRNFPLKQSACLLGAWDGLRGVYGSPSIDNRKSPYWFQLCAKIAPYRLMLITSYLYSKVSNII